MADENDVAAVTGRANDIPVRKPEDAPLGGNSTFASRAKERAAAKAVKAEATEDKSVRSSRSDTKRR